MKPDQKVFLAYYKTKKHSMYFNELKEETGLSDSSLANTLKQLVEKNVLQKEKTKSTTNYHLAKKKLFALKFSELALRDFEALPRGIRMPITEFVQKIPEEVLFVVLFGSAAKNQVRKNSDLDLLIVARQQESYEVVKKEVNAISNYPLNLFTCTQEDFRKGEDPVVLQAKTTGYPVFGEQRFYEVILREP